MSIDSNGSKYGLINTEIEHAVIRRIVKIIIDSFKTASIINNGFVKYVYSVLKILSNNIGTQNSS